MYPAIMYQNIIYQCYIVITWEMLKFGTHSNLNSLNTNVPVLIHSKTERYWVTVIKCFTNPTANVQLAPETTSHNHLLKELKQQQQQQQLIITYSRQISVVWLPWSDSLNLNSFRPSEIVICTCLVHCGSAGKTQQQAARKR